MNEPKELSWWSRLFRSKARLTYWLGDQAYETLVCGFTEKEPTCIVFRDYWSKKSIMVRHSQPITYVLEVIK